MRNFIHLTDGYKLDHRRQYPAGTEYVYSNFTARSSRIPGETHVVFFGLQGFLAEYFMDRAQEQFFSKPKEAVLELYQQLLGNYFGPNDIGVAHIAALHDLGYIPLRFKALPEGTAVPLGVPMFTIENTHPDFFWVTNYFETLISSALWLSCTSATTARRYRKLLDKYAMLTTGSTEGVQWQAHDFSFRGMASPEAAVLSGAAHLLFFTGSDCLPAIDYLQDRYLAQGPVAVSVPATEHSVMCASGQDDELETYRRILNLYPSGIVSVVSDTWDLWNVITNILPQLRGHILSRDGKLVIRPDSGDPADILCGEPRDDGDRVYAKHRGVIQLLWDEFGGTVNDRGYKVLNSHIGAIYGDSITEARADEICSRLERMGFASTNVVFGIGSYTYNYTTRDVYSFAIKATWTQRNGVGYDMQKDPVTGSGKKSAKGRLAVLEDCGGDLCLLDELTDPEFPTLLRTVWENGEFTMIQSLDMVRYVAKEGLV